MIRGWLARHRNPTNLLLHAAGIPATVVAVPAAVLGYWLLAVGLFVGGYALQFLGHIVEGNPSGEEELIRKLLGRARRGRRAGRSTARDGRKDADAARADGRVQ